MVQIEGLPSTDSLNKSTTSSGSEGYAFGLHPPPPGVSRLHRHDPVTGDARPDFGHQNGRARDNTDDYNTYFHPSPFSIASTSSSVSSSATRPIPALSNSEADAREDTRETFENWKQGLTMADFQQLRQLNRSARSQETPESEAGIWGEERRQTQENTRPVYSEPVPATDRFSRGFGELAGRRDASHPESYTEDHRPKLRHTSERNHVYPLKEPTGYGNSYSERAERAGIEHPSSGEGLSFRERAEKAGFKRPT